MMRALSRRARCALGVAAMLACGTLQAQSGGSTDALDLLSQENLVYSAARYVQTLGETPANVTIVSRDDIRRYGYRSVHEALKSIPGVFDAASQWPAQGVSGVAVPGDFGSRILYLINGMPIYEPTYGGFFLDYLDIESIDRIEFVKGAGSALYGSGAVMGLVNLITGSGTNSAGQRATIELASDDAARLVWSHKHQGQRFGSFVSASVARRGGRDLYLPEFDHADYGAHFQGISAGNDRSRTLRLFARLAYDQAWVQTLLVSGSRRDPLASYDSVFNGALALRESLMAIETGITHAVGDAGQLSARTYFFNITERGDYPYAFSGERGVPAQYINVSDLSSRQLGAELRYDRFVAPGHHVLAGLELKHVNYAHQVGDQPTLERSAVYSVDAGASYMQWALFAQDEIRLGTGRLFLGARFDSYHGLSAGVGSRLSPRVAYVRELGSGHTVKLMYGEAYRAPTIYESHYQDGLPAASTIWANHHLRPELARSLEALLISPANAPVEWRASVYLKHLRDTPVQFITPQYQGQLCALGVDACIQYRNSGQTQRVIGTEFDVRLRQGEQGDSYASLVLQHGHDNDGELSSSPRYMFKTGISRALPWQHAEAALEAYYASSVTGRRDSGTARRDRVPAYLTLAGVLNFDRIGHGWRASLGVDNLLDRRNATVASRELQPLERVPAQGRRFSAQLQRGF